MLLPFIVITVIIYLKQKVAHLCQTAFGSFLEAVKIVPSQNAKSFCVHHNNKKKPNQKKAHKVSFSYAQAD